MDGILILLHQQLCSEGRVMIPLRTIDVWPASFARRGRTATEDVLLKCFAHRSFPMLHSYEPNGPL